MAFKKRKETMIVASYRIEPTIKQAAEKKCKKNKTALSDEIQRFVEKLAES